MQKTSLQMQMAMLLLLAIGLPMAASAQTVTIGTDTSDTLWNDVLEFIPTNSFALTAFEDGTYTNYYFPMYVHGTVPPSVCYNKSECIIPATELAEMCHGSTINAMTFYPSSVSNISWENTQHKVFLKEVPSTTLGGHYSGWNDATIVFEGQLPEPTANSETYTITFQQNYTYNGGNLLIGIYSINGASGSVTWKGVSSTEAGVSAYGTSLYSYDDVNYYEYYQSNRSFLPKTTFSYFPCDTPKPKNLTSSNITADEATLSWVIPDALTTITGYQYSYKKMNDAEWSQDYSTTATSVTIDGLDEQTRYQFRVRACYGDLGQSDYTTTNFTTALQAESFTFADVTTGGSSTPFLGNRVNYGTHGQFIIPATSLVDIVGSDIRRLSFYISTGTLTQTTDWGGAQFEVWIAEVDNTTFSSNALYPWEDMTLVFSCDTLRAIDGVMHIDLDPYYSYGGHNLLIGFKQIVLGTSESINWCGEYGHSNAAVVSYKTSATSLTTISRSNYLPKTTIYYQATDYPRILDIYTDTITSTMAQLSWIAPSPNVTGYRYQYKLSSVPDWTTAWESLSASSTSVMLESLLPASDYDFRIKVIYGEQESIVTTTSFTTAEVLPSCIAPSQLEVTTNALSATLTWVSGAPTCQVAHSIYANSNPQYNIAGTTTDNTYTLDNLTIDKDHYFWVRGICGNNDYSEWAGPISIHIGYCEANPTQRSNKGIVGVAFGNGDYTVNNYNANGLPARSPYYGNYTNMVGAIQAGVQDTIKITTNTSFYDNSYWIRIWVDFNNNLIFDDDENIYRGWAWDYGEGTINAIITIPATQAAGDYRMRIGGCEYLQNENDPCLTGYLQAGYNDYTLRVLEMPVFTKDIAGHGGNNGGYYLIASPIVDPIMPSEENGFITDTYDLYRFNPSHEDNEWENYKTFTNGYEIENGKGYLYASHDSTTLIFTGSHYNDNGEVILVYDATDERKCWNLVGNPFPCEATLDREYYVLNDDGKTINPTATPTTMPIPPFTAIFVKAVSTGDRVIFAKMTEEPDSIWCIVPEEQRIGQYEEYAIASITGGLHLNFTMTGVTHVVMESVDGYALAGIATTSGEILDGQSIITFTAPEGGTFEPNTDYYIVTFPSDVYGGYRLSIYKDGLVAHYFGVHQAIVAGDYITPFDLNENELEFDDPDAPFVEEEPPGLNQATRIALARYLHHPTESNRLAIMEQMGLRYDKVVARKKAKLRELEREAHHQSLIDEMQAIVDEMVTNREMRLEQQFRRLVDQREDDDTTDEWLVLRGVPTDNAYIAYAPVTNEEYAAFDPSFTYPSGHERYPVVNITFYDAVAYCDWLGSNDAIHAYRVTIEDDWIMGAGHMPKDIAMNSGHIQNGLTPVDYFTQSTGACGGVDFWGNCWEWTSTQNASGQYIVKGGAWNSDRDSCRTEYSGDARDGNTAYPNVGFRVVRVDR